ncbi:hypothetical protein [Paenibacillus nasutitermitis]|uniref:Polymerase beta nucleotidyltransferase domain-containing protein n=1 Tax=Paenibacillus nasutitermitis TaxID=1652958 RepID=A0A916YTD9_9BACL|nr:hypothetical protein [Paenibacillus nasutitermitis]GGD60191.1 hypothetical protein GCM10010911_17580 [Paenibacillus nasutitermitis]
MEPLKTSEETTALFREALHQFVEKIQRDEQVIAAVLVGSLSYDQVWEKSDIDLKLIVQDQKLAISFTCFVEQEVPINTTIQTRNEFKRWVERSVSGSFGHSMLSRSTLLFTKDDSITEYFEQIRYVGERDRQLQLMLLGGYALGTLAKAEKWLYVKKDPAYSTFWIIKMIDTLSQIEVLIHGDIPMRESVQQAMVFNPAFFDAIYTDLIWGQGSETKVYETIERIQAYLNERAERLFQPVLDYLKQEEDVRSVTEIALKFGKIIHLDPGSTTSICDWLVDRGLLVKLDTQTKATPKSKVILSEPAYLFGSEEETIWKSGGAW